MTELFKTNFLKSSGNDFFYLQEQHLNATIPSLIKNNLILYEYCTAILLSKFDDESIRSMEDDIRNNFNSDTLVEGDSMEQYLGRFSKCQDKFKFMDGHRKWFTIITDACKNFVGETVAPTPSTVTGK